MKHLAIALPICAAIVLPACSTVEGVGKDVSAVGQGISHVANEARDEMFASEPRYAKAGEACDPSAGELDGGNGLPACDDKMRVPAPVAMKRTQ